LVISVLVALAGFLPQSKASLVPVSLGSDRSFAVLAGSGVTDAGAASTIKGNVGLSPTTGAAITGLTAAQVSGTIYAVDAAGPKYSVNDPTLLSAAKNDLSAAYLNAAGQLVSSTEGTELGGSTLVHGVYNSDAGTFGITGILTLDAQGDPNAAFIFKMTSTLTTAVNSHVELINGAQACNVFWQVGSTATLGGSSIFEGNVLALASINLNSGASVNGRLLAQNGAVTLDDNTITVPTCIPEASSFWPGAFCVSAFAWQWLAVWRRKAGRS
jgi:hypothetical protein